MSQDNREIIEGTGGGLKGDGEEGDEDDVFASDEESSEEEQPEGEEAPEDGSGEEREDDDDDDKDSDSEQRQRKEKFGKSASFGKGDSEEKSEESEDDSEEPDFQGAMDELQDSGEDVPVPGDADLDQMEGGGDATDLGDQQMQEQLTERQKLRKAKEVLRKRIAGKAQALQDLILHCGYLESRPFESKRWDFDALLRAWVRDSLTYDQYAFEMIEDKGDRPHHWVPVDGSTVRQATPELKNYKNFDDVSAGYDILYPEKELEAMKENDALELDDDKLQKDEYKWVQVIQGRVVRGFTEAELCVGMRNPTTDVYANGYSLAELELLTGIVSSHIFTENYNKSYFTQGFSAKGLLHIKSNVPKRKLESFRAMWNHMLKGNKNSFQTPIIAGVDEVNWIPLTQNHSDIEFNLWMQYLIKVICAIYQIDPMEIGFGMRDMGQGGGTLSGDNSEVKLEQSKSKGLRPMLRHFATFINKNIIDRIDPNYKLEWVGVKDESTKESIERELKESQFKKTVNELREENGLPPLPGCDDLILNSIYFQWYNTFSAEGKKNAEAQRKEQAAQMAANFGLDPSEMGGEDAEGGPPGDEGAGPDIGGAPDLPSEDVGRPPTGGPSMGKSQTLNWRRRFRKSAPLKKSKPKGSLVSIEYYRIKE
jgi:hypothetical protein